MYSCPKISDMASFLYFIVTSLVFGKAIIHAAYCSSAPQPGERTNDFPIDTAKLRFKRSIKNAMLFEAGPINASFPVLHIWVIIFKLLL